MKGDFNKSVNGDFNKSEIRSRKVTSTSPSGYQVLSMTGTDSRTLRYITEGQPEFGDIDRLVDVLLLWKICRLLKTSGQ